MTAAERYTTCEACGMEYSYVCDRENYCPGCGSCWDYSSRCTCDECLAFERQVTSVAAAADISTKQAAIAIAVVVADESLSKEPVR